MALNIPKYASGRIVVIGGGFAGLTLVRKLAKTGYQTVLIDRNNFHQFPPLFYQVATSALNPGDIAFPFRKLFRGKKNVFFRMTEVKAVDPVKKRIKTEHGTLPYDYLVLATGSRTNYFGMRRIEQASFPMKDLSEALAIRNKILLNIEKAVELPDGLERRALLNIVIVGGGATGVELAGAFAEMKNNIIPKDYPEYHHGDINIFLIEGSGRLISTMGEKTSAGSLELLRKAGVKVMLNSKVTDYRDKKIFLQNASPIPTHNLIWTSGVTVNIPAGLEKCPRGRGGRVITDDLFRLVCHKDIFVIGDASVQISDKYPNGYPQLARVAIEQAKHLARNFKITARGKDAEPYVYKAFPVMATVRRNHAFAEFRKFRLSGFFAWTAWAAVHLFSILGVKNKLNIFWGWFWNYVTFDLPTRIIVLPKEESTKAASRQNRPDRQPEEHKQKRPGKRKPVMS